MKFQDQAQYRCDVKVNTLRSWQQTGTAQVKAPSPTYEDISFKCHRALASDSDDITTFLELHVPTIARLTPHPSTPIANLLVIILNRILIKYVQIRLFGFLPYVDVAAQLAAMQSANMGGSESVFQETGQGETEFIPPLNGKTRSKSIVPLPPALESEFQSLKEAFTITTGTLKEIVGQFEKELAEGLEKDFQNIVGYTHFCGCP